jgi:hypothetical protein
MTIYRSIQEGNIAAIRFRRRIIVTETEVMRIQKDGVLDSSETAAHERQP